MDARLTCNITTLSNASPPEISADTCLTRCSHQVGEENRCVMEIMHRSKSTGGMAVGSADD